MATLGRITVADASSVYLAGAALPLSRSPKSNASVNVSNGWLVEISSGTPYVVARGLSGSTADEALTHAQLAAQEGLDILCAMGVADLAITGVSDERIVWWRDAGRQILRIVSTSPLTVSVKATATVLDASGAPHPSAPPAQPQWLSALRYFRLSQVTSDLFDAYRNLWLAFEFLLSHMLPPQQAEGEAAWLRRVLATIHQDSSLAPFVANSSSSDPPADFYREQYVDIRCRLFHSKRSRPILLPQREEDRAVVVTAIQRLARAFILLMQNQGQFTRASGGVTYGGFALMMRWMDHDAQIRISPNDAPPGDDETLESSVWETSIPVRCAHSTALSSPGIAYVLGTLDLRTKPLEFPVCRLALVIAEPAREQVAMTVERLGAPLVLDAVDTLQIQLGVRLVDAGLPRAHFPI